MDISVINEVPAKRLPIKNCVVGTAFRPKAYSFIAEQVRAGHQAYVICPLVEETENSEGENVTDYANVLKAALPKDIDVYKRQVHLLCEEIKLSSHTATGI